MKNITNVTHHIISPHRDDSLLSLGGYILSKINKEEPVTVYVVYGIDGYMRDLFKDEILRKKTSFSHLNKLRDILDKKERNIFNKVDKLVDKNSLSDNDLSTLGICIRKLEERAAAERAGYGLFEYDFACGYPLRDYQAFNQKCDKKDLKKQIDYFLGKDNNVDKFTENQLQKLKIIKPNLSSPVLKILDEARTNKNKISVYFPSGIGGHPDHVIWQLIGAEIEKSNLPNIKISYYSDAPYNLVSEWYQKSKLVFHKYNKNIFDISQFLNQKINLLSLYRSQLNSEDLRLARLFPKYNLDLINRNYCLPGIKTTDSQSQAIEVLYTKK